MKKRGGVEGTGELWGTVTVGSARVEDNGGKWKQRLGVQRGLWWQVGGWSWEELRGHHVGEKMSQDGAHQTEAGRATQERKQRPLLEQTGRN